MDTPSCLSNYKLTIAHIIETDPVIRGLAEKPLDKIFKQIRSLRESQAFGDIPLLNHVVDILREHRQVNKNELEDALDLVKENQNIKDIILKNF